MNFLAFETLQGALVGIVFLLGTLVVAFTPKYKWTAAAILLAGITPLALLPFLFGYDVRGISDWDYYFSMHTNVRDTIVHYHQFPLWNPYTCGGTSALGDPEFPAFSPLFLLELVFGTPVGLQLSIWFSTAILALGMLFLGKKIGLTPLGALLAALGASFGTANLLESVEGHQNILAMMYVPWAMIAWHNAYTGAGKKRTWSIVLLAIFLALMFFQGGIYLLMYTAGAFLFLILAAKKKKQAMIVSLVGGMLSICIAAVKVIPVLLWVREFQDTAYASSTYLLPYLDTIFLGRILHGAENIIPNQGSGWHEYGAYIGPVILTLAAIGSIANWKKRIVRVLLVGGAIALLIASSGPLIKPLFDALPFIPRSNISRLIAFTVIPIALVAGYGIDWLIRTSKNTRIAAYILIGLAAIDLVSLLYPLASQAFVLPKVAHPIEHAAYPIAYTPFDYKTRHNGADYTRAYDAIREGYGSLSYCAVLGPSPAVSIITDEGRRDFVSFTDDTAATFTTPSWSPNTLTTTVTALQPTDVTINANYAKGWMVNGAAAREIAGKVGTRIAAGTTQLTFSYTPPGVWIGSILSFLTALALAIKAIVDFHKKA